VPIPVLTYSPSLGVSHSLRREFLTNQYEDGYSTFGTSETSALRANGTKGVESYKGLNEFTIVYNRTLKGAGNLADLLWDFFLVRLENLNEPFYFYNPTEMYPPDPTGAETRGRYYVCLKDPEQGLSREHFRSCLLSYGVTLIEVRDFSSSSLSPSASSSPSS
jgi:hypothetical protein